MMYVTMLLTQEEVDALPDGTKVMVLWSGGNGPFEYILKKIDGITHAGNDAPYTYFHSLDRVGEERYNMRVWLPDESSKRS